LYVSLYFSDCDHIELTVLAYSLVNQQTTTAYCYSIEYNPKDVQEQIAWLDYLRQAMARSVREASKESRLNFLIFLWLLMKWQLF